jgi:hypothetical protein
MSDTARFAAPAWKNDNNRIPLRNLQAFDFNLEAELYPARARRGARPVGYKRFVTAAQAIRFAIEELPAPALLGAYLEVGEARYDKSDIQRLYESTSYPLPRPTSE